MKIFLSSSFGDLQKERRAVMEALQRRKESFTAMEYFLAMPETPLVVAFDQLHQADVVLVVVGFLAGSLIPDGSGRTYTLAEFEQAERDQKPILGFVKKRWKNKETSLEKRAALDQLKMRVDSGPTRMTFTSPDSLALAVIQSLDAWESRGRPGARKTFDSAESFFRSKTFHDVSPILDFSTTLFGRETEIESLNRFLMDEHLAVCVVKGRGGIGKTKLLHDWVSGIADRAVIFLKDSPLWQEDAYKEVPAGPTLLVIDDAHLSDTVGRAIQLFSELRTRQDLKLAVATRPIATMPLMQAITRQIDASAILDIPELQELTSNQALKLAEEILGPSFSIYAKTLAEIAGNTPLVIVAGGRLIASDRISPAQLTNKREFRNVIFNKFLNELNLEGPRFPISPARPVLNLIAALSPVDVNSDQFLSGAERFRERARHEILSTLDQLAECGIIGRRGGQPIRILPDVLSDFILEDCCTGPDGQTTTYADHVYEEFGDFFFTNLMRNFSELDWRLGRGSALLEQIWIRIFESFKNSDGYGRGKRLEELAPAAVFQPERVIKLVSYALEHPIDAGKSEQKWSHPDQRHVVRAVPLLLQATAYHFEHIQWSVDTLWKLAQHEDDDSRRDSESAVRTLKRLASYDRFGWPPFNFAMLIQAIRLCQNPDAFARKFTPVDLVDILLEREGEFTESDGMTVRFGGFGLNYRAVGDLRNNAIDFLEFLLGSERDVVAVRAIHSLQSLLHQYLNRGGSHTIHRGTGLAEWGKGQGPRYSLEALSRAFTINTG